MTTEKRSSSVASWLIPAVIGALAGSLVTLILTDTAATTTAQAPASQSQAPQPSQGAQEQAADFSFAERRDGADPLAIGAVDAPVVMIAFSDYQCPYCAQWSAQTLPAMLDFVDQGVLRIEWRDVNIFGADSERAALATYAAAQQGAFLEYHEALFEAGTTRSPEQLSQSSLVELAAELGLDPVSFEAALVSAEAKAAIDANAQLGFDLGATSTPAFIIGGVPLMGAQPTETFVDAVQSALVAASS